MSHYWYMCFVRKSKLSKVTRWGYFLWRNSDVVTIIYSVLRFCNGSSFSEGVQDNDTHNLDPGRLNHVLHLIAGLPERSNHTVVKLRAFDNASISTGCSRYYCMRGCFGTFIVSLLWLVMIWWRSGTKRLESTTIPSYETVVLNW